MNPTTVETATKGIKDLSREVQAFEVRLQDIRSELTSGKLKKEALDKEIESKRSVWNQEVEESMKAIRIEKAKNMEASQKLLADKEAFEKALLEFRREKNAFDREKTDILTEKKKIDEQNVRVTQFMRVVRQEAERL